MKPRILESSRIAALTPSQCKSIERVVAEASTIEPHHLANVTGITAPQAIAFIACLESDGLSRNLILIYHSCEDFDLVCGAVPFRDGLPRLPWKCDVCNELVEDERELAFRVMAKDLKPFAFR